MKVEDAENRPPTSPQRPARFRLRPAHLLIWTIGISAYLAIIKGLAPQPAKPLGMLAVFSLALGVGTAWAGGMVLIQRARTRDRWPWQPGHWLLALLGIGALIDVSLQVMPETVFARPDLVLSAAVCWLFVLPLFSQLLSTRWKGFFLLMVLLRALPLVLGCLGMVGVHAPSADPRLVTAVGFAADPIAAGSLLTTCLMDRRAGQPRGWLHWCGVLAFLWLTLLRVVLLPRP